MSIQSKWRLMSGAAAAVACLAGASAHATTPAWVSTATQAIPLIKATLLGPVTPTKTMRISVALQMQNAQALRNLVQAQSTIGSPQYGTVITPAQFNATYAPSAAAVSQVQTYLQQAGLSN